MPKFRGETAQKPNHRGGPRRESVCRWDCANVKKPRVELLAYCHLTMALFVPDALPSSEGRAKQNQKPAIRLKQSPCVLINIHLHENGPLWLNSGRWVQRPMWCYGQKEAHNALHRAARHERGNLPLTVWPALLIVNVSFSPTAAYKQEVLKPTTCWSKNWDQCGMRGSYLYAN